MRSVEAICCQSLPCKRSGEILHFVSWGHFRGRCHSRQPCCWPRLWLTGFSDGLPNGSTIGSESSLPGKRKITATCILNPTWKKGQSRSWTTCAFACYGIWGWCSRRWSLCATETDLTLLMVLRWSISIRNNGWQGCSSVDMFFYVCVNYITQIFKAIPWISRFSFCFATLSKEMQ